MAGWGGLVERFPGVGEQVKVLVDTGDEDGGVEAGWKILRW